MVGRAKEGVMSFRIDFNICDPMIASCQDADGREVLAECLHSSDSLDTSLSDNYSLDNRLETAVLAYSIRAINNVVGTVDGVRHVAESECASGIRERTGLGHEDGFIPQTLVISCFIGGMIVGTVKGIASLPGRVVDFGRRLFSGAAENVGEALADLNFFAIEFAGYGQMGVGAVQAFKGGASISVPLSDNNIGGFSGGAAIATRPTLIPALATAGDICVASGEATVGVVAASSDDFGGPMAPPRPMLDILWNEEGVDPVLTERNGGLKVREVSNKGHMISLQARAFPQNKYVIVEKPDGSVAIRVGEAGAKFENMLCEGEQVIEYGVFDIEEVSRYGRRELILDLRHGSNLGGLGSEVYRSHVARVVDILRRVLKDDELTVATHYGDGELIGIH